MADRVVIIGAGIGGLAAAMRLAHSGCEVTVIERHDAPGGKMRLVDSLSGPIDAGPSALTMRFVFEELFDECGASLSDHARLLPLDVLARHRWSDGSTLDLFADAEMTREAIAGFAGTRAGQQFAAFHARSEGLFRTFHEPVMRAAAPGLGAIGASVLRRPWLLPSLTPGRSLSDALGAQFTDPRLRQLFGRFSTYVGGFPNASPALLAMMWHAESLGVWTIDGGLQSLARAMHDVAARDGARFRFGTQVDRIHRAHGRAASVQIGEERIEADAILFNGDVHALSRGLLPDGAGAIPPALERARGLSACVWAFSGRATGLTERHNVYFADDADAEAEDISLGAFPSDPTLFVSAQDRGHGHVPDGEERIQVIMNAPTRPGTEAGPDEKARLRALVFDRLERMGLRFDTRPPPEALTTPEEFHALYPGTDGALYGMAPKGPMAAFRRPKARTALDGLYLCGGGAHPGAGLPLAALSGSHAAEAILRDRAHPPRARMPAAGGMLTAGRRIVNAPRR